MKMMKALVVTLTMIVQNLTHMRALAFDKRVQAGHLQNQLKIVASA